MALARELNTYSSVLPRSPCVESHGEHSAILIQSSVGSVKGVMIMYSDVDSILI